MKWLGWALVLALLAPDRASLSIHALTTDVDFRRPDRIQLPPDMRYLFEQPWDHLLCDDMAEDPVMKQIPAVAAGLRGSLRVPLRRNGEVIGGLNFMSRARGAFTERDAPVAVRVAAYVALTLAHKDLADEAARADYAGGVSDLLTVLTAQTRLVQLRSQQLTLRRLRLENRVNLHLALGGDFAPKS